MRRIGIHSKSRVTRSRLLTALLLSGLALSGAAQIPDEEPSRYDVDQEFAQGIVRDVSEGGRMLLVELREDHELMRGTDPVLSDPAIAGDPRSSALRADDRRDGRLRKLDLERATGWAFIDDLEGGEPEAVPLDEMYPRFRIGQIVEIGGLHGEGHATLVDTVGSRRGGSQPDPRDRLGGATAFQGRVDTLRFEGQIQVRINRAFE